VTIVIENKNGNSAALTFFSGKVSVTLCSIFLNKYKFWSFFIICRFLAVFQAFLAGTDSNFTSNFFASLTQAGFKRDGSFSHFRQFSSQFFQMFCKIA
jgi:hypothetical protein